MTLGKRRHMRIIIEKTTCDGCGKLTNTRAVFNKDFCIECKPQWFTNTNDEFLAQKD